MVLTFTNYKNYNVDFDLEVKQQINTHRIFSQSFSFEHHQEINFDKQIDLVQLLSEIEYGKFVQLSGEQLKKLIFRAYNGKFKEISMLLRSTVNNNIKTNNSFEGNPMEKKLKESLKEINLNPKLQKTIMEQSYRLERARKLKGKKIELPKIDEDLAKAIFDIDGEYD